MPQLEIISRAEAKQRGLMRYFTGKPCINGHIEERMVTGKACMECNRFAVLRWSHKNKDKIRTKYRLYYLRYHKKILARRRAWRNANIERLREQQRLWRLINRDRLNKESRANYQKNRVVVLEYEKKWRSKHGEKIRKRDRDRNLKRAAAVRALELIGVFEKQDRSKEDKNRTRRAQYWRIRELERLRREKTIDARSKWHLEYRFKNKKKIRKYKHAKNMKRRSAVQALTELGIQLQPQRSIGYGS